LLGGGRIALLDGGQNSRDVGHAGQSTARGVTRLGRRWPDACALRTSRPEGASQSAKAVPVRHTGVSYGPLPTELLQHYTSHTRRPRPGPSAPGSGVQVRVSFPPAGAGKFFVQQVPGAAAPAQRAAARPGLAQHRVGHDLHRRERGPLGVAPLKHSATGVEPGNRQAASFIKRPRASLPACRSPIRRRPARILPWAMTVPSLQRDETTAVKNASRRTETNSRCSGSIRARGTSGAWPGFFL
jgi:hypothetical protein